MVCRIGKGNEELQEHILKGYEAAKKDIDINWSVNWLVNGLTCPDFPCGVSLLDVIWLVVDPTHLKNILDIPWNV